MYFTPLFLFSFCFCGYTSSQIQDPRKFPEKSVPTGKTFISPSYVYDPEGFLTSRQYERLNNRLAALRPTCEMVIIFVDRLSHEWPRTFTRSLRDRLDVGRNNKDYKGVLLSLVVYERKWEFAHPAWMNERMSDRGYNKIADKMKPFLRNADYFEAALVAIDDVEYWIKHPIINSVYILPLFSILGIILVSYLLIRWCSFCTAETRETRCRELHLFKTEVDRVKEQLTNAQTSADPVLFPMCSICFKAFSINHLKKNDEYLMLQSNKPKQRSEMKLINTESEVETLQRCGHQFHTHCIRDYLSGKNICPLCGCLDPRRPFGKPKKKGMYPTYPPAKEYAPAPMTMETLRAMEEYLVFTVQGGHWSHYYDNKCRKKVD